jgi:cysteinyl-tRNA synthetase
MHTHELDHRTSIIDSDLLDMTLGSVDEIKLALAEEVQGRRSQPTQEDLDTAVSDAREEAFANGVQRSIMKVEEARQDLRAHLKTGDVDAIRDRLVELVSALEDLSSDGE